MYVTIIMHQTIQDAANNVLLIADDADVFVLLCHFIFNNSHGKYEQHSTPTSGFINNVIRAHSLSGCNIVVSYIKDWQNESSEDSWTYYLPTR